MIIQYLNNHDVSHKQKKLIYGDYSFLLPADPELGIVRDVYFNDQIVIERKASLEELSGNMTHNRQQFENELIRSNNAKLVLMIENKDGYKKIVNGDYNTEYNPKAYLASLLTFQHRYNITIQFIDPAYSGQFIRYEFYDLFTEVSNYKNQLAEINFQNKKLLFDGQLTDTKKDDFISSLENIKIQMEDDLYSRTFEFYNEIKVLMDSASTYNDYNELWYKVSDLVYAEQQLMIISLNQISLITNQGNMNTIERELYNEIISIKLDFASLRLNLALR